MTRRASLVFVASLGLLGCGGGGATTTSTEEPAEAGSPANAPEGGAAVDGGASSPTAPRTPCGGTQSSERNGQKNGGTWAFAYGEDRLTKATFSTTSFGLVMQYSYDAAGFLSRLDVANNTAMGTYTFAYEGGRIATMQTNQKAVLTFTYDDRGRLARRVDATAGTGPAQIYEWAGDNVTSRYEGSEDRVRYDYTTDGRLTAIHAFDATKKEYATTKYTYAEGRLARLEATGRNGLARDVAFTYTADGDLAHVKYFEVDPSGASSTTTDYDFDYACWNGKPAPRSQACASGGSLHLGPLPCFWRLLGEGTRTTYPY